MHACFSLALGAGFQGDLAFLPVFTGYVEAYLIGLCSCACVCSWKAHTSREALPESCEAAVQSFAMHVDPI